MAKASGQDIDRLTFEQAITDLKGIVEKIEKGKISLQDSIQQYEKGMALIKHCRGILQQAEKRIERSSKDQTQAPEAEPKAQAGPDLPF